jgi:hypothetical protein
VLNHGRKKKIQIYQPMLSVFWQVLDMYDEWIQNAKTLGKLIPKVSHYLNY